MRPHTQDNIHLMFFYYLCRGVLSITTSQMLTHKTFDSRSCRKAKAPYMGYVLDFSQSLRAMGIKAALHHSQKHL